MAVSEKASAELRGFEDPSTGDATAVAEVAKKTPSKAPAARKSCDDRTSGNASEVDYVEA